MNLKLTTLTTITILLLTACNTNTRKDFACKPVEVNGKLVCPTITEADNNIKEKQSTSKPNNNPTILRSAQDITLTLKKKDSKGNSSKENNNVTGETPTTHLRNIPTRTPEKIGKIWFAPFLDEGGNFFDETYAYVILEPARWQVKQVKQTSK